jgi:hypothetical protein
MDLNIPSSPISHLYWFRSSLVFYFLAYQGFKDVSVNMKEESKDVIKQWLPGSGAEDYVVSAEINAKR